MWSLKDKFSKVTKKLNDQDKLIKTLKLSNVVQKQKLAQLGDNRGDGAGMVAVTRKRVCQNREASETKQIETMMSGLC